MTEPALCANCGAQLAPDQPAGHDYCDKCSAAWHGAASSETVAGRCANCGSELPSDQPAGHNYCEKCTASWRRN